MKLHTPLIVLLTTTAAIFFLIWSPVIANDNMNGTQYYREEMIIEPDPGIARLEIPGILDLDEMTRVNYIFFAILVPLLTMSVAYKFFLIGKLVRSKEETLENQYRSDIYRYIQDNPGVNKAQLSSRLNINMGTLRYHIDSLKSKKLITEIIDGKYTRFFGCRIGIENGEKRIIAALRNENKRKIMEAIIESPGLTAFSISSRTGIGYTTTSECLKQMFEDNMLLRKKDAQHYGYNLNPDMVDIVIKSLGY